MFNLIYRLKSIILFLIVFIISTILITTFSYFNYLNNETINIFKFIIVLLSICLSSIYISYHSNNKGYIEGLIFGITTIFILFIINIINKDFNSKDYMYYLIILLSSVFAGMLGKIKKP